uniref:Uncharacterized protein n=1 Tax=Davidia involucrata TaxID=16924 RepID=A0A5B6ZLH9_DAVIN
MKDLLKRKPSLAELTGISESRLDCFATHLRAYLVGSTVTNTRASAVVSLPSSPDTTSDSSELCQTAQSSSSSLLKPSHSRHYGGQVAKTNPLYQGSLSPRSSTFKEGLPRNLSSLRSVAREKLKQRGGSHLSGIDDLSGALQIITTDASSSNHSEKDKLPEASATCLFPPLGFLESLGKSAAPPFLGPASQVPSLGCSLLSPYYCWCPPVASALQYAIATPQLPISSTLSQSLPPLSSLLPATRPSSVRLTPTSPLNLADVDFPPFLPEPLVRLPLSVPSSQQIPTFTPLMCDPIVHIPVIDVCSSGQGYLVSAMSTTIIPPLHPKLVNPLIPETDSMVEKGARETLRLLISSSSQSNPQLMGVLPSVLDNTNDIAGSRRGLYSGATDVGAIANSIAAMGLVSLSERPLGATVGKRCISQGNLVDQLEKSGGPGGSSCSDDESSIFSKLREERTDFE